MYQMTQAQGVQFLEISVPIMVTNNKYIHLCIVSRPQEWFNRSWGGLKGRVESFLKLDSGNDSTLEELVGEKITPENTSFYVCGWQGTVDGALHYLVPKGFVTERNKRKDGRL